MHDTRELLLAQIPRLRRYARALCGDVDSADDLVQDCLARALPRLDQWQPGSDMRAWLFSVMHNLFVDQYHRRQRQPEVVVTDLVVLSGGCDDSETDVRLSELQAGLRALSAQQREVLLLASIEGLAYRQVAEVLGIPVGTVMSRLHRGREQLRKWMNGEPVEATGLRRVK